MDMPQLAFRAPAPQLTGLISTYYWVDAGGFPVDDMIHPEWANVRFTLKGQWTVQRPGKPGWTDDRASKRSALFGPSSRGARVTAAPGSALLGFGLLPMGWARLIGGPARRLADDVVPLDMVWPADRVRALVDDCLAAADLDGWAAALDSHLLARLAKAPPAPPLLGRAHEALVNLEGATVERFAEAVQVSVRTLERQCGALFGFGPKTLLRRQRFLRALDQMIRAPERKFATLILEDYTDQSHFIHEFKAFMGVSPSRYMAQPRIVMQRAAAERAAMFGESMQALQGPA